MIDNDVVKVEITKTYTASISKEDIIDEFEIERELSEQEYKDIAELLLYNAEDLDGYERTDFNNLYFLNPTEMNDSYEDLKYDIIEKYK
jgi:hypothetical protein